MTCSDRVATLEEAKAQFQKLGRVEGVGDWKKSIDARRRVGVWNCTKSPPKRGYVHVALVPRTRAKAGATEQKSLRPQTSRSDAPATDRARRPPYCRSRWSMGRDARPIARDARAGRTYSYDRTRPAAGRGWGCSRVRWHARWRVRRLAVSRTPATAAIMRETQTIPVVFASVSLPWGQVLSKP